MYYHVGSVGPSGELRLPAHLAMFVREISRQAGSVTYYGHTDPPTASDDTTLEPPLVRAVGLGPRRSFPARTFFPGTALRDFDARRDGLDVMLVRGPSPLLPRILRSCPVPAAALIVGDYSGWQRVSYYPWWRNSLITAWVRLYTWQQKRALRRVATLANSPGLARELGGDEVFTSSITESDVDQLPPRSAWTIDGQARVLYTGRIAEEKGLFEAVEAIADLRRRGRNIALRCVGWADDPRVVDALRERATELGVSESVSFPGYRPAGPELYAEYLDADLYLMASRAEGFPRTLTEALAAELPVVATRVGGIPERLEDGRTALLIEPSSSRAISDAIELLLDDAGLRARLASAGRGWARDHTNERSCALILDLLRRLAN